MYETTKKAKIHKNRFKILERVQRYKHIPNITSRKKKVLRSWMRNEKAEIEASSKGIANTFAKFYSSLIAKEHADVEDIEVEEIPTNHDE